MRKLLPLLLVLALSSAASPRGQFSYIYKNGDHTHIRNSGTALESMIAMSKRWSGEFVWLKHNGRAYLIRDAAVLAEVREAFAELHAYEPRLRAAEEKLHPVERKMERIERQMDKVGDRLSDDDDLDRETRRELERQLRELEVQFNAIEREYLPAERESERMEREHDRLEEIAEARFEKIVLRAIDDGRVERAD
jgi:hypothetical protein